MKVLNFKSGNDETSKYFKLLRPDQQIEILNLTAIKYKEEYQEKIKNLNQLKFNIENYGVQ